MPLGPSGSSSASFKTHRARIHEAKPIASVYFGLDNLVPDNAPLEDISTVFPVASETLVYWDRNAHIGFAVQDVTEIFVRRTNPDFTIHAGDVVYAYINVDGNIDVGGDNYFHGARKRFMLGVACFDYDHNGRSEGHMSIVMIPNRMV